MADFLSGIVPVSLGVWMLFFIIPAVLSFLGQLILCSLAVKVVFRLIPIAVAFVILVLVALCSATGFLGFLIGGFVSLLLIGTAVFIIAASIIGWLLCGIIKLIA